VPLVFWARWVYIGMNLIP